MTYEFVTMQKVLGSQTATSVRIGLQPFLAFQLTADRAFILASLREDFGKVIADYLRANFDLGENDE